jgi:hypothetical protein
VRTLDAFRATLLLARETLGIEALAHLRIGLEQKVAFAWVVADPGDFSRLVRIARDGLALSEKQLVELVPYGIEPLDDIRDFAFVLGADGMLEPVPSTRELCAELDRIWRPRLDGLLVKPTASFSYWYSYVYRGASAFVQPTSRGIQPLYAADGNAFLVRRAPEAADGVLQTLARVARVQIAMASFATPWLVDPQFLHGL